ncbi:MAG: hypothetical protein HKN18_02965 [Silicimonas sp.]|nr:hypothetical protein [Silicimonas sp.]
MSSKLSMQAFGLYLVLVAGFGLIFVPHFMLGMFGLSAGDDAWVRMVGMLASIVGAYYLVAATTGAQEIIRWSIPLRVYAASFMVFLFISGTLPVGILLFAAIDVAGAMWTWSALKLETQSSTGQ